MVIPKPVLVSAAACRRHAHRPLLHAARLPPRGRGHRCDRHRHRLRAARQPRPGARRPDAAGRQRHWSRSSTRPAAFRSSSSWRPPAPRCRSLRASLVRTARRLFAGSVFVPDPLPSPAQGDHDVDTSVPFSPPPALVALLGHRHAAARAGHAQAYPDRPITPGRALCRRRRHRRDRPRDRPGHDRAARPAAGGREQRHRRRQRRHRRRRPRPIPTATPC